MANIFFKSLRLHIIWLHLWVYMAHKNKFFYRFLFVWIYFLGFQAFNTKPSFNQLGTQSFITKSIALINKNTIENPSFENFIFSLDLNSIARIMAHIIVFGFLSIIIMWAVSIFNFDFWVKILISILICSVFGLIDEVIQLYTPQRHFRCIDILKDDVGAFIFTVFLYQPFKRKYHSFSNYLMEWKAKLFMKPTSVISDKTSSY